MFPAKAAKKTPSMIVRRLFAALVASTLLLAACRKAEVSSYRIPKEKDPEIGPAMASTPGDAASGAGSAQAGASMAGTAVPTADGGGLTWTAPADWQSKPASAMRKATYMIPGEGGAAAELSITAFPGDVGGELANLNRWRGQVQLPPLGEGELATAVTRSEHDGLNFGIVDLAGANGQRLLGAWVPVNGATWFFKLTGSDALLAKEKPAFLEFLSTVKPAGNGGAAR